MGSADKQARNDPPINKLSDSREEFLRDGDEALVDFVEVKAVAHGASQFAELLRKRVESRLGVKRPGQRETEENRAETREGGGGRMIERRKQLSEQTARRRSFSDAE